MNPLMYHPLQAKYVTQRLDDVPITLKIKMKYNHNLYFFLKSLGK